MFTQHTQCHGAYKKFFKLIQTYTRWKFTREQQISTQIQFKANCIAKGENLRQQYCETDFKFSTEITTR